MGEHVQESVELERLVPFPMIRKAVGFKTNVALIAACGRHGVPIVTLSSKSKALRQSDYALLLTRASGEPVEG